MLYTDWIKKAIRNPNNDDLVGLPVPDVMDKLSVSKQRVHQMIDEDLLDGIAIVTKKGNTALVLVTQASLDYYLTHRRPYGAPGRFTLEPDPA